MESLKEMKLPQLAEVMRGQIEAWERDRDIIYDLELQAKYEQDVAAAREWLAAYDAEREAFNQQILSENKMLHMQLDCDSALNRIRKLGSEALLYFVYSITKATI